MVFATFLCAFSALAGPAAAPKPVPDETTWSTFIRHGYFDYLDYNDPDLVARIPDFDSALQSRIPAIEARLKSDDPKVRQEAAFSLSYVAMYMANVNYGVTDGRIDPAKLLQSRAGETAGKSPGVVLEARNHLITRYLEEAQGASPHEVMIAGWLAGARLRENDLGEDGCKKPNPGGMDGIVKIAEHDKLFNLFSALILAVDHPLSKDESDRLFEIVKYMTSSQSPCQSPDTPELKKVCRSNPNTPFSEQGAMVMLADAYFKKGLEAAAAGDSGKGTGYYWQAMVMYQMLKIGRLGARTRQWVLHDTINDRIARLKDVMFHGKKLNASYWQSDKAKAAYQCAACHASRRAGSPPAKWSSTPLDGPSGRELGW